MNLSLAGWSLEKLFRRPSDPLLLVDFPAYARDTFGLTAVELNNIFFASTEAAYLGRLVNAARAAGVQLLNIAVDEKGDLSSDDASARELGLVSYSRWIPIAADMGIAAIRANSGGAGITDPAAGIANAVDSFRRLIDLGQKHNVAVLMENHWGISSDPANMVQIMTQLDASHPRTAFGTLPDFGNWDDAANIRYDALRQIMPWAKAVHAKFNDIDEALNHPRFDHATCLQITHEGGYDGWLGIEYEGEGDPVEGVQRSIRKLRGLV